MVTHRAVYVASEVILLARERESFRISELKDRLDLDDEDVPANSTIRLILQQLEESGWLERRSDGGHLWYASDQAVG